MSPAELRPLEPPAPPDIRPERGWLVLDRDGVINRDRADYVKTPAELEFLPGSLAAIAALGRAGFGIVVATNQSGVGRGLFGAADLEAIHDRLRAEVSAAGGHLAGIFACPHAPDAGCPCRKPRPGLLERIAQWAGVAPATMTVVGDAARDLAAARAVGALAVLVRTGHGEDTLRQWSGPIDVPVFADLAAFARQCIGQTGVHGGTWNGA